MEMMLSQLPSEMWEALRRNFLGTAEARFGRHNAISPQGSALHASNTPFWAIAWSNARGCAQGCAGARPRVATMCSGSDVGMVALGGLLEIIGRDVGGLGGTPDVSYEFACEVAPKKREFLLACSAWRPRLMFEDVRQLANPAAMDVLSGELTTVPSVDLVLAGPKTAAERAAFLLLARCAGAVPGHCWFRVRFS